MESEEYMNRKTRKQRLQRLVYSTIIIILVIVRELQQREGEGAAYLYVTQLDILSSNHKVHTNHEITIRV
jgi:hypothetical protein